MRSESSEILLASSFCFLTMAAVMLYFGPQLMTLFTKEPEVVDWGMQRMRAMFFMYCLHTVMQVFSGTLRGMGRTLAACLIVLVFACLFRILWILFIFPLHRTMFVLLQCFPVSWLLVSILSGTYLYYLFKTELRTIQ
jgi:Na+-driven multidrug efflux pump